MMVYCEALEKWTENLPVHKEGLEQSTGSIVSSNQVWLCSMILSSAVIVLCVYRKAVLLFKVGYVAQFN